MTTDGEHTICLDGTDVDSSHGDTIEGAVIVALPAYGVLYQVREGIPQSRKCMNFTQGKLMVHLYR